MDSTNNQKKSNNNTQKITSFNNEHQKPSRFSRRRFIQASAMTSPLLLSIKSPVAWGGQLSPEQCSVTALMSGNASHPHNCQSGAKSPGYWHKVFDSRQGDTHYPVQEAINGKGIDQGQSFNAFFLSAFFTWHAIPSKGWEFKLSTHLSDNPTFRGVLPRGTTNRFNLVLEFRQIGTASNFSTFNIGADTPNLHKFVVAGYLNSLFSPGVIIYPYQPEQIEQAFIDAIITSASEVMDLLNSPSITGTAETIKNILLDFRDDLNTWD